MPRTLDGRTHHLDVKEGDGESLQAGGAGLG